MNKAVKKIIILAVVIAVCILFAVIVIQRLVVIKNQNQEIASKEAISSSIVESNSGIQQTINDGIDESDKEQMARENGYVYPEERVYYN